MNEHASSPHEPGPAAVDPGEMPLAPDEEIVELEKLLAAEPDDFQARCRLGELYFSKGRLDDASSKSRSPSRWRKDYGRK